MVACYLRRVEELEGEIARLLESNDLSGAASAIMRSYGPSVLGYLASLARDEDRADDVFAQFCEDLWRGLPGFRRASSARTGCTRSRGTPGFATNGTHSTVMLAR
jgi:hypothetical protein